MITSREELLAEQVNVRIAQMRSADRWWWLANWRDWVQGTMVGFVPAAFPLGMYFWFNSSKAAWTDFIPFAPVFLGVGIALSFRFYQQEKMIKRLEERVKFLEEGAER